MIAVNRQFERTLVPDGAQRLAGRLFRLERLAAQGFGKRAVRREGAGLDDGGRGGRGDQVAGGGGKVLLLQRRGAEAGIDIATDGEVRRKVIARRDLAGDVAAEIRIVFVAQGGVEAELVGDIGGRVDIDAGAVAALVDGVGRLEATKALGARGDRTAGQGTGGVGFQIAGVDLIGFVAGFETDRDGQRGVQADVERTRQVGVEHRLVVLGFAVIERGLRRGAIGRIDAVQREVVDIVAAIGDRVVLGPAPGLALDAEGRRIVLGLEVLDRQEAVRIDRGDIARRIGVAEKGRGLGIVVRIAGVSVDAPIVIDRLAGIDEDRGDRLLRIAVARGDDVRRDGQVDIAARGGVALLDIAGHGDEAVGTERQADPAVQVGGFTVVLVTRRIGGLDVGVVLADTGFDIAAVIGFAQMQVEDAGNGVGAVLGRGAVTQHFDTIERGFGDGVQVDGGRTAAGRTVDVDQGRGVPALTVDQDEGFVGRQAAQLGRADVVGGVRA